jgi:exonuclease VII small subunit|tara:strand:- start:17 stop:241 length:225 start_codon:yes stop_codon:yes gene_type:complete
MKSENIPAEIKSKSIKEVKDEINLILGKLENNEMDFEASRKDYERLLKLNKYIDQLFKEKVKMIASMNKKYKND